MTPLAQLFAVGFVLALVQGVAALPWLAALNIDAIRTQRKQLDTGRAVRWLGIGLAAVLAGGALLAILLRTIQVKESLDAYGRIYGIALYVQLVVDFFVLAFAFLTLVWPKGAAVALAAFREGWRQPMYWLLTALALTAILVTPIVPYFT